MQPPSGEPGVPACRLLDTHPRLLRLDKHPICWVHMRRERKSPDTRRWFEMSTAEQSIELKVPVRTAYNQWTQFEEFPRFMEGVESVKQIDDTTLHWVAEIAGTKREWDAKITEQKPDERIAWTNIDGAKNAGVVTFHHLDDNSSKVMLQMEFDP